MIRKRASHLLEKRLRRRKPTPFLCKRNRARLTVGAEEKLATDGVMCTSEEERL